MGNLRVRWPAVARRLGAGLAVLLALQTLPSLLRPPSPPPLAADVGLPRPRSKIVHVAPGPRISAALPLPSPIREERRTRRGSEREQRRRRHRDGLSRSR